MSLVSCHELSAFHCSSTHRVSAKPLKCDSYSLLPAMNLLGDIHLTHFCPLHAGRAPLFPFTQCISLPCKRMASLDTPISDIDRATIAKKGLIAADVQVVVKYDPIIYYRNARPCGDGSRRRETMQPIEHSS